MTTQYKYSILITDPIEKECISILEQEEFRVIYKPGLSPDQLCDEIQSADAVIVRSGTKLTKDIIEHAGKLKIIGRAGTGVDNIDLDAATRKGIIVMNAPGGNTISTAEHTISLLLALARKIPQAWDSLHRGNWDRKSFRGVELYGKTVGIIGAGKIGREVGIRLQSFGMTVLAYDPLVSADVLAKNNFESVNLEEVLRRADVVSIHTPLNEQTKGLLNETMLRKCKRGVLIVNCARGGIVDEAALLKLINEGYIGGAALDVFEVEPPVDNRLINHPNVVATPHLGAATVEAQEKVAIQIARQIADALMERALVGAVNIGTAQFAIREDHKRYLELTNRLGRIAGQLMEGKLRAVTFTISGEALLPSYEVLFGAALRAILSTRLSEPVNEVNAPYFAKELGISINRRTEETVDSYINLITIEYETEKERRTLSGTVFSDNSLRLVSVDGFHIEARPEGHMLVYWNIDRPGMLAAVGTVLANANINIAGLSLGRTAIGEKALTIVTVDSDIPHNVVQEISTIDGVMNPKVVKV